MSIKSAIIHCQTTSMPAASFNPLPVTADSCESESSASEPADNT